jgi:ABC-type Fe3+-hydroxamate transport system, periplasmic component
LEWTDPPFSAGHWNPELLALANATPGPWDEAGVPSRTITWEEIVAFAPEMLVLIPCGFDANRAIEEAEILREAPGWYDLPAVRQGECYTVDGNAYFNRPGPRLAESAEILATVLHPDTMLTMVPPYSVRRFPEDLVKRPKEEA